MTTIISIYIFYLLTLAILAIYSLSVFKKVSRDHHPMLIFFMFIFLMETIKFFLGSKDEVHIALSEYQDLANCVLVCWQARRWQVFEKRPWMYKMVLGLLVGTWIIQDILGAISFTKVPWFTIIFSFTVTLLGIEILSKRIIVEKRPILRSTIALFSIGLIFYYSFVGLLNVFMIIGKVPGEDFLRIVAIFYIVLGLAANFIYLRSLLCISRQPNYYTS